MSGRSVAIVGAGQAGFQAAASLREMGFAGAISLYGDEPYLPYQRPPLSKTWLKEAASLDKLTFRPSAYFTDKQITVHTGSRVVAIDRARRTLALASGTVASWDRLILATGVANRRLEVPGVELAGVAMLRGIDDADAIRALIASTSHLTIVGGGIIGLEVAAMARGLGIAVDIVELGDRLVGRIGSAALSEHLARFHRDLGTAVHLRTSVASLEGRDGRVVAARLSDGRRIETTLVLIAIGVTPNTALAAAAGLEVRDGILVDAAMRTSDPAISAIGDCARFKSPFGAASLRSQTIRLESVQNAIDQGRCAAHDITGHGGSPANFDALPWFWSDQGSLKLQIAGLVHGHDRTIVRPAPQVGATSIYCFADDELIGVECINRPADFMAARRILAARVVIRPAQVEAADFDLRHFMPKA